MSILLDSILHTAIDPALRLFPPAMDNDRVRVCLLAIGLQESGFIARFQRTSDPNIHGPAEGYWQNELGGVSAVMGNTVTRDLALSLCSSLGMPFDASQVHSALEHNDVLAAGFARLLLYADPHPLPDVDDANGAWATYLRCWRPGKPRPADWPANHAAARSQVMM